MPVVVAGVWLGADHGYGTVQIVLLSLGGRDLDPHRVLAPPARLSLGAGPPVGSRLHFIIHGVHHDHPNDRLRLVMPPAVSVPLAALFLWIYTLIFGTPAAYPIFAGFIIGYLTYDYTHYHVHHHTPRTKLGQEDPRAAHAPPLPGPPVRVRGFVPVVGRRVSHPAPQAAKLSGPATAPRTASVLSIPAVWALICGLTLAGGCDTHTSPPVSV